MAIFIIGDLHLGLGVDKPMHVFGEHWRDHHLKIEADWRKRVGEEDTVILAGDTSWALKFNEIGPDFDWISSLPGKKILLKGNHDYWWTSVSKMKKRLPDYQFLYNSSIDVEGYTLVGTRGWSYSKSDAEDSDNRRIFRRETLRLKNSLNSVKGNLEKICILHYPPFNLNSEKTEMNTIIEEAGIKRVFFGHIHANFDNIRQGLIDGVHYKLISADYLGFKLHKVVF